MQLSDAEAAACRAVIGAPEAWSRWDDVAAGHDGDVLLGLVGAGVLELWDRPDYVGVTLTPYGAWLFRVEVAERWRSAVEEEGERDGCRPLMPAVRRRVRVLVEVPVWREEGRPEAPLTLPRHARIGCSLFDPESVPDHRTPENDPSREVVTDDDGEPVKVLGVEVKWARRALKGKGA